MLLHPLTSFEIQKHYQNKPRFSCVYSRNNLPKTKDREYVINLDQNELTGTHWIALFLNSDNITYFDTYSQRN